MGLVAATFKMMPKGPETDIAKVKEEVKSIVNAKEIREVPIAFGLVLVEVLVIFEDKDGIGSIEEKLSKVNGIASVESGDVTLL